MNKLRTSLTLQLCVLLLFCASSSVIGLGLRNNIASVSKPHQPSTIPQSIEKVIVRREHLNEPFEISGLGVQNINILPGQKFDISALPVQDNWLNNLQFTFRNKTDSQITRITYALIFPEARSAKGGRIVYQIKNGLSP